MKLVNALMTAATLCVAAGVSGATTADPLMKQDPDVLRWVERAIPWYPGSVFEIVADTTTTTPSGAYRVVRVKRTCENKILTGEPSVVIDTATGLAYLGPVGELPFDQTGASPRQLRPFLESFLPEVMQQNMNMKIRVSWDVPEGASTGAVIPFHMVVETGYGVFDKPVAVTADGKLLIMGSAMPFAGDPVAIRRELFRASDVVVWDHAGDPTAVVEIVEFSDLECPACKARWPMVKQALESNRGAIRHGMVSFPLTSIHPWAFRASSATWCVGVQKPEQLISFKELFYQLQREMEVSLVTPTATDFVVGSGLDEATFKSCYLKRESLDAVHAQLELGHRVGVNATPTYFVNGWMVQMPTEEWFPELVARLARGEEP